MFKKTIGLFVMAVGIALCVFLAVLAVLKAEKIPQNQPTSIIKGENIPVVDGSINNLQPEKRFRNISPDGKLLATTEKIEDPHIPNDINLIKLTDLSNGVEHVIRIQPALSSWYVNEFYNYPKLSEDAYPELRILGWSPDGRYIFVTQKPNDLYNENPHRVKYGDGLMMINVQTGETETSYEEAANKTVYDSVATVASTLIVLSTSDGFEIRSLDQKDSSVLASVMLPKNVVVSGAIITDDAKYLAYVLAEGDRTKAEFSYSSHLYDIQKGIDYPLFNGDKTNQIIEINNWYFSQVLNIKVIDPATGRFKGVRVDVGDKIVVSPEKSDILTIAFGGEEKLKTIKCVYSGLVCIDETRLNMNDLNIEKQNSVDFSVPVLTMGYGYEVSAVLKDAQGNAVATSETFPRIEVGNNLSPQMIPIKGSYTSATASANGTLVLTVTSGLNMDKVSSVDIPITLPNISADKVPGQSGGLGM